jgi:hypothetical protein
MKSLPLAVASIAATLLLALTPAAAGTVHVAAAVTSQTGSPVERVVKLLTDLKETLLQDEKEEKLMYDKYACWCTNTAARKATQITDGQALLRELKTKVLEGKGEVASTLATIAKLKADINSTIESQESAQSIRAKQHDNFVAETTEMKEVLSTLEEARIVLRKGTTFSLLQGKAAAVKKVLEVLPVRFATDGMNKLALLASFASHGAKADRYTPQSMTVQGILEDMYTSFAKELETASQDEAKASRDFEQLYYDLEEQKLALQANLAQEEEHLAATQEKLASDLQLHDDTDLQLQNNIAFFDSMNATCTDKNEEWTVRSTARSSEILGIRKALEILSTDDARKLFGKTIKAGTEYGKVRNTYGEGGLVGSAPAPALIQLESSAPGELAYQALRKQASETHSLRLAALAAKVRLTDVGHFSKVMVMIDAIINDLKEEDKADIKKRDECIAEYHSIESVTKDLAWRIKNHQAKIEKLASLIEVAEEEKEETIKQIKETEVYIDMIERQREADNGQFKKGKADDMKAIELLEQAKDALAAYYKEHGIEMGPIQGDIKALDLHQEPVFSVHEDEAPELKFKGKDYRKNPAKDILSIMTMIIEDLQDEIKNDMAAEEKAQLAFEAEHKEATKLKADLLLKKSNLEQTIASLKAEKTAEEETKEAREVDKKNEEDYLASIKTDCDWIIGSFEERNARRVAEMNGLAEAKSHLAGMKTSTPAMLQRSESKPALLQNSKDRSLANIRFLGIRN